MLCDYLDTVRDVEHRVEKAETRLLPGVESPAGVATAFAERMNLMFDMIALAFQADITRVASFMMAAETSQMTYDHLGVPDSFHLLSHHQNDPAKIEKLVRVQAYHTRVFASFVRKLAEMPDGDGSMLDRSLILYGSNMSNSHAHDHFPLPLAVIGGGCGTAARGPASALPRPHTAVERVADDAASVRRAGGVDRRQHGRVRRGRTEGPFPGCQPPCSP